MIRVIFDGNNTAYRCNCVTELYTKDGRRTSAIYGVLQSTSSTLLNISKLFDGECVAEAVYVWDAGHSKRRKELYPDYKGNRNKEKTPEEITWMEEFKEQANNLHENLNLFGVKSLKVRGWEADDLIYGLSERFTKIHPKDKIVLVSTDEDYHQLISNNISLYSPIKQILYTIDNYKELTGIDQSNFITYKILKGDSSDNINGIAGIGEKTSKSLVNEYGHIGQILRNKDKLLKSKRTAKIFTKEGLQILDRNNKLINLKEYVDLSEVVEDIEEIINEEPFVKEKKLKEYLSDYQLSSILTNYKEFIYPFNEIMENYDLEE